MNLRKCQEQFREYLVSGIGGLALCVEGDSNPGLSVYHAAYRARLTSCLRETFERVHAWLGDDAFETAARRHIEANPPTSWSVSDYGAAFEQTLLGMYPDDCEVAELAWLDWALRRAFDGPDAGARQLPSPEGIDWDRARFRFVPTLRWRRVRSNCAAIWSAISRGESPPAAARTDDTTALRVWRTTFAPQFRSMSMDELRALELAHGGAAFGEICNHLAEPSASGRSPGAVLAAWLQDGLIVSIEEARSRRKA